MMYLFNKNQHKKFNFPIFDNSLFKMQKSLQYDNPDKITKMHIIVVEETEETEDIEDIRNTFKFFDISILDKTYVEKYLIYVVQATNNSINKIAKYKWVVNISRGI